MHIFVKMYTHKKSLGQHFLKDKNVIHKILASLEEQSFDNLLEVGPGAGALTEYLMLLPGIDFKAVELDQEKVDYLEKKYPAIKGKIIHQDFLNMENPFFGSFVVIGNFPYNISTQILFKILEWKENVPVVIGMFQKEVAQRAAAKAGNKVYGVLSVFVQAYYEVEYLFEVDSKSFIPPPKVQSAVIKLKRRQQLPAFKSEKLFWILVKMAFNQRRKTLRNAVKYLFTEYFLKEDIFNQRAEKLTIDDFAALTHKMKEL